MVQDERSRLTLRIPEKLIREIKITAKRCGVSANALILQILREWAQKEKEEV